MAAAAGSGAGDHHTAVHAVVQGATVGVGAGLVEGVGVGPAALGLAGLPAVAGDVVGDEAVLELPGDLCARRDLDGGGGEAVVLGRDLGDPAHRGGRGPAATPLAAPPAPAAGEGEGGGQGHR